MDREQKLRQIVANHQAELIEGILIDASTAHMLVKVLDALNQNNKARFLSLPIVTMAKVGWKLVN